MKAGECLPDEIAQSRESLMSVDRGNLVSTQHAFALNGYQPGNAAAFQETRHALHTGDKSPAAGHGLALKGNLEEIDRKIAAREKEVNSLRLSIGMVGSGQAAAGGSVVVTGNDPWTREAYADLFKLNRTIKALKATRDETERNLKLAAGLVEKGIRENADGAPSLIVEARLGGAMAALGQYEEARGHFKTAARQAQIAGLELEGTSFRLEEILALPNIPANLEKKVKDLEALFSDADREIRMRESGPETFALYLESRGDLDSWRTLRGEILTAILETCTRSGGLREGAKARQAITLLHHLLQEGYRREVPAGEAMALLDALEAAQRWHIREAYREGSDAREESLTGLFEILEQEYRDAEHLFSQHTMHAEMRESLGAIEGLTYFHFWQQAGLPITALHAYWNHTKISPPSEAQEHLKKIIRTKAPHLFDTGGHPLPKGDAPLPGDHAEASFAEDSLHYDDAGLVESVGIGGGASVAGAAIGFKSGLVCGPYAGVCATVAAVLGGAAGFVGGEALIHKLHEKERERFVGEAKQAGLALNRLTPEEAKSNETSRLLWNTAGIAIAGAVSAAPGKWAEKFLSRAWFQRETWQWAGRRLIHEGKHTGRWIGALFWTSPRAFFKQRAGAIKLASLKPPTFTEVFELLTPWERGKGAEVWRSIWHQMENLRKGAPAAAAEASKQSFQGIDRLLGPLNQGWDFVSGPLTRFGEGRLQAVREAVLAAHPKIAQSTNRLVLLKELRRAAYIASKNDGSITLASRATRWTGFETFSGWLRKNVGTKELARAHRFAIPPAIAGLFYDSDGKQGGGWTLRDWEWDAPWEFASFFFASNVLGAHLINNSVLGADIGGGIALFTIDKMLDMSEYEGSTDYGRARGTHLHYHTVTGANSLFISGHHYLRNFALGRALASTPMARLFPSMTRFPSSFRPSSGFDKPNFLTLGGLATTLAYQSYGTGYVVGGYFSKRPLMNTDPYYYQWQRGVKYATVVPGVNMIQAALGYRSTLGQTVGRVIGVPGDLALALSFDPFLNKGRHENKMDRLLDEETPPSLEEAWNVFAKANTTLDLGGVVGRMFSVEHPLESDWRWRPFRIGHWRWERRGIETWTSPTPIESLSSQTVSRKGFIEEMAERGDWQKIRALVEMYRLQFLNPAAEWRASESDRRGIVIFAFMTKYFAERASTRHLAFGPFHDLTQETDPRFQELRRLFDRLPTPQTHEKLLEYVTQVDEGDYDFLFMQDEVKERKEERRKEALPVSHTVPPEEKP